MKNKKVKIVDALQHKELIGDEFEIQYIIKPDDEPPMTIKQLADKFDKFTGMVIKEFENVRIEMREGFKQVNDRIDNLVKKNNLKE
jgi:hypothetical protein